jgi:hypothetical protein
MKKSMKPSKLKKIVVKCLNWTDMVEIDGDIFDDVYMEAATRVVEKNRNTPDFSVSIVMMCYEKKDEKNSDKHICYNTYYVLVNAALYEKAELLRLNFLKTYAIDIQKQSLHGTEPGTEPNTGNAGDTNPGDPGDPAKN